MDTLQLYNKLQKFPFGKRIFSYMLCYRIPYFFSIKPLVLELQEGKSVVQMHERRSIHNHLQTIHAIALCNLCEAAMAVVTDVTIPKNLRFIPAGMTVEYKRKAKGTVKAISRIQRSDFHIGNTNVPVDVYDEENVNVMSAVITLNIKEK